MNLLLWSAQAAAMILTGAALTRILRSAPPWLRLALWQLTLAASLLLPVMRPWQSEVFTSVTAVSRTASPHVFAAPQTSPAWYALPLNEWLLVLLAAGVFLKLTQMGMGLFRLRQYRRNARPFTENPSWNVEARLLTSDEITSPVTFGFFSPVILLPSGLDDLAVALRETLSSATRLCTSAGRTGCLQWRKRPSGRSFGSIPGSGGRCARFNWRGKKRWIGWLSR